MQQNLLDNRYELLGDLGGGGMARVSLARDRDLGRDVAIKMLREQYAEDAEFVERFRREAQSAAALSHPNIVQIYDRGRTEDGRYYIAMEHVPDGTLKEMIERSGPLPARTTAGVGAQIAEALGAAHEGGVVHRDVKPHNVLVTANGDAKVADFGIARAAAETSISRTDVVMGTAAYMAPEQAMGGAATPRSDLYSLGVVLYEMATGEVPFVAESPAAVSFRHVDEEPRPPAELNPEIPPGLNDLVLKLLSKDPADRYPDAAALVADLERVGEGRNPLGVDPAPAAHAAGGGVPSRDTEAHREAAPVTAGGARRRRGPVAAAVLASLVGLLCATGWVLWSASDEPGIAGSLEGAADGARDALEDAADGARGVLGDIQRSAGAAEKAEIPRVEGLELVRARQELSEAGFDTGVRPRESSAERTGEVLEQSVPAGDQVERGSKVLLAVGKGPGKAEVPKPASPEGPRAGSGGGGVPSNPRGSYGGADTPASPAQPSSASASAPAEQPAPSSAPPHGSVSSRDQYDGG